MDNRAFAVTLAVAVAWMASIPVLFGMAMLNSANGTAGMAAIGVLIVVLLATPNPASVYAWRRDPLIAAGLLLAPLGAAAFGLVISTDAEHRRREDDARSAASYAEATAQDARESARRAAEANRQAEARRRAEAEEAARTPAQRLELVRGLLSGQGDAGAMSLSTRVCRAREQVARIGGAAREGSGAREVLRALARAERDALREEQEAFREVRMVMCCDGMTSPSCTCRRSSHRGCCSHHGGMCGCEPLPTELFCSR